MAWTAPRTWVAAEIVTAALMNTHLRDNMLETAPAIVTTAGDIVYADAANSLVRLGVGSGGTFLRSTGTAPEWADPSDGSKLDGDTIDIDGTPTNYTPVATSPASDVDDLWAHLLGIDNALGANNQSVVIQPHNANGTGATLSVKYQDAGMAELTGANDATVSFYFRVPDNWSSDQSFYLHVISNGTGTLRYSISVDYGNDGEALTANTDSVAQADVSVTDGFVKLLDLGSLGGAKAAGDGFALTFTRHGSHANDTITAIRVGSLTFYFSPA
jgi:hypothetical protein